jgi:hypothetical protein
LEHQARDLLRRNQSKRKKAESLGFGSLEFLAKGGALSVKPKWVKGELAKGLAIEKGPNVPYTPWRLRWQQVVENELRERVVGYGNCLAKDTGRKGLKALVKGKRSVPFVNTWAGLGEARNVAAMGEVERLEFLRQKKKQEEDEERLRAFEDRDEEEGQAEFEDAPEPAIGAMDAVSDDEVEIVGTIGLDGKKRKKAHSKTDTVSISKVRLTTRFSCYPFAWADVSNQ